MLQDDPNDPDANQIVGAFRCFVKGDWEGGLPMLALGNDAALRALAARDMEGVSGREDQVALGDAWWELASKDEGMAKESLQQRAAHWYRKAMAGLTGLVKEKIAARLKEIEESDSHPHDVAGGVLTSNNATNRFLFDKPKQGEWAVRNGQLILSSPFGGSYKAVYKKYFNEISSVTIRGGIIPPNQYNFRISVGPVFIILNWEAGSKNENLFYGPLEKGLGRGKSTRPRALTPGRVYEIVVRQLGERAVVLIDGQQHFVTKARLNGTVTIYATSGPIVVQSIEIDGIEDAGRQVVGPSHYILKVGKRYPTTPE